MGLQDSLVLHFVFLACLVWSSFLLPSSFSPLDLDSMFVVLCGSDIGSFMFHVVHLSSLLLLYGSCRSFLYVQFRSSLALFSFSVRPSCVLSSVHRLPLSRHVVVLMEGSCLPSCTCAPFAFFLAVLLLYPCACALHLRHIFKILNFPFPSFFFFLS